MDMTKTTQNIMVNIRGSQADEYDDSTMELYTEGMLTHDGGKYIIEYDESEISGMENTRTSLTVEGDRVQLRRTGAVETEFVFLKSRVFEAAYETPFGMMQMSVPVSYTHLLVSYSVPRRKSRLLPGWQPLVGFFP